MPFDNLKHNKSSKEDRQAIRALADDHTIVIKRTDRGLCVVVWDRMDYLLEVEKQFRDSNIYGVDFNQSINFKIKLLTDLVESSNNMYLNLK